MTDQRVIVDGCCLSIGDTVRVAREGVLAVLDQGARERVRDSRRFVELLLERGVVAYGVTTGVGKLSDVVISRDHIGELQRNLLRSHACGVGEPLAHEVVRAVCLLRANALARGQSGVRVEVIEALLDLLNRDVVPVVPGQGSLGASGDLAPLAHVALVLMGEGEAWYRGERLPGDQALTAAGMRHLVLEAKEALALINGTQVMAGIGALAVRDCGLLVDTADAACALTVEALRGIPAAYSELIQGARGHPGQLVSAGNLRRLLANSELTSGPGELRVQDAYTLRCAPQVHGASRDALEHVASVLAREINAATDNPLLFPEQQAVLSGGNFHGQPLALPLDYLGIAAAELGSISERRTERLVNPALSGLPAFLTSRAGLNSGFMILQYTAASLVSENKVLASPASVDSIPSSANQEDHVSMGTIAARKLRQIIDNVWLVQAIELLCGAQAVEFHPRRRLGDGSGLVYEFVRKGSDAVTADRSLAGDIERLAGRLASGELAAVLVKHGCLGAE